MIHSFILIFIGTTVLSASISYAYWTRLRVVLLRQRLFDIRDALWDAARTANGFDDLAYREARHRLNMAIKVARWISLPVVSGANLGPSGPATFATTNNQALQDAIDKAYSQFVECIVTYLMRHTACGVCVLVSAHGYALAKKVALPLSSCARMFVDTFGRPVNEAFVMSWMGSYRLEELSQADFILDNKEAVATA